MNLARAETGLGVKGQGLRAEKGVSRGLWAHPDSPHLQVSVDNESGMHVLQAQDDLTGIKAHLLLRKHPMLGEVVVHVAPCNQRPRAQVTECSLRVDRGHPK